MSTHVSGVAASRTLSLTREGAFLRCAFRYDPKLLARVKEMPYASFDGSTKTWTVMLCAQTLDLLRQMHWEGLTDVTVDSLLEPGEQPAAVRPALLRSGSMRRPFVVATATRDEGLYARLKAIPGSRWEGKGGGLSYGPTAATALAELVDRGVLDDPERLLSPADVVVTFDGRNGQFHVRGDDRAARAFKAHFPQRDVVGAWQDKGLDVAFSDDFTEEVYRGEMAKLTDGIQPDGMSIALYPYQRQDVAVALERSGLGLFGSMGVGKCLRGDSLVWANGQVTAISELFDALAGTTRAHDEEGGEWAVPTTALQVRSYDEAGRAVEAPVARLYRQHVRETLRTVTLDNGAAVTITAAHRLLTEDGWTNELARGQRVAVPSSSEYGADGGGATTVAAAELGWATIRSVEAVAHDGYVYDLEVPTHHNFVAGGIVCHNTILGIATGHELAANRKAVSRVVVVVPPAVRTQWRNEIIRFTGASDADVVVINGDKKKRMAQYEQAASARWVIVHYQAVILPDDYKALSKLVTGSLLIADECHRLKNETATTTKKMRELNRKAARRLGMSGTPVENNPGEWFNLISGFIQPGIFGSPTDFLNRYSYPGRFGGFEGARNLPELRERSRAFYVRRTLNEVAPHLPKMRVETIVLEPRPEYASALRRAHNDARDEIAGARLAVASRKGATILDGYEREEIESGAEMTAVGMLKLLCSSPHLIAQSDSPAAEALRDAGIVPDEDGPKLDEVRVMAAEMQANGERLVIFTSSKRMANLVAERFAADGIRHVLYTGDTSSADRDKAQTAFITPSSEEVPGPTAFISTDAGAEGLNLGRCCSTLVNLDVPWTPGRLGQRNARVRRIDSTATSFLVVNLVLAGTIEAGILRMVEHKADLADAILGESGGRKATTGRGGRNIFEAAMADWVERANPAKAS